MKRILTLLSLLFSSFTYADTINLHWKNYDGTSYQDSTCVVDSDLILPSTTPTRYGYTFTGWKISNYTPIKYIESTGTQWIDTKVFPDSDFAYELKFSGYIIPTSDTENIMFGETSNSWVQVIGINQSKVGNRSNVIPYIRYDGVSSTLEQQQSGTFLLNNQGLYFNNLLVYPKNPGVFGTETYSIYLFAINRQGTASKEAGQNNTSSFTKYRLEHFKVWRDNNVLIRDFIPVLDENDVPCMFDRVTGQFYYNQGTGNFIAGPALE